MIHDVIYSLLVLIEKLAFFNKELHGFIIYLTLFDIKLKLIAAITCIYIKLRYTFSCQFKYESRETRSEENSIP